MQGVKTFVPPRRSLQPYLDSDGTQTFFNSTQATFVDRDPTTTKPVSSTTAGAERFVFQAGGQDVWMHVFGTDADGETVLVRVTGWTEVLMGANIPSMWLPKTQWEGTFTLSGSLTGVAGHPVMPATILFADLVVESASAFNLVGSTEIYAPGNNIDLALAKFPHFGGLLDIQVELGTAASGGVVVALG